jgi:hypothetical protein
MSPCLRLFTDMRVCYRRKYGNFYSSISVSPTYCFQTRNTHFIIRNNKLSTQPIRFVPNNELNKHALHILILGCPGSGKGTQAQWLQRDFEIQRITTGDLLRNHVMNNTKLGQIAKASIEQGGKSFMA